MSGALVLRPAGDVDVDVVGRLRPGWYALAEQASHQLIVVDLRDVTFIDATGLGLLAGLAARQRRHGGTVTLREAPPLIMRLLRLTGLLEVFPDADERVPSGEAGLIDLRDREGQRFG